MKTVLQAVLFLGFVTPSFSAAPEVDFDGRYKIAENQLNFFNELSAAPVIPMTNLAANPPELVRIMERLNENGEFVEVIPEIKINEAGKKVPIYNIQPNWWVRWNVSCSGNGNWSQRITYAWDTAAGGHNHSNPPPPPLLFSNSQSAQLPPNTEWAYTPSPINFPVMQGYNKSYYYWMWYPEFATKLVEWTEAWGACVSNWEEWTYVKVDGLENLPAGVGYVLRGDTTYHPANHYVAKQFKTVLQQIGKDWNSTCPESEKLNYNDMSLIWGGKFDLWRQWGNNLEESHKTHMFGNNADVSKKWVRKGNRAKLIQLMCKHADVRSEGDAKTEPEPHFHLTLKGSKHKEDYDEKLTQCCTGENNPIPAACIDLQGSATTYTEVMPVATNCPDTIPGQQESPVFNW